MKVWKYVFAPFCIAVAVFGILEAVGVIPPMESLMGEITLLRTACALFCLALFLKQILKGKLPSSLIWLSFLFMSLEPNIAYLCGAPSPNLINNWLLLFYTLLACLGLSLLMPKRWKLRRSKKFKATYQTNHLSGQAIYIDCTDFTHRYIENNMGSMSVRFENTDAYTGGGVLHVENNLGATDILIPMGWTVDAQIQNSLGSVGKDNELSNGQGPLLTVMGENNLGSISIRTEE